MSARAACALLAATLLACGPGARDAEVRQLRERVEAVQGRMAKLDTQLADLQNQLFLVTDQLNRERAEVDATRPPPRLQVVKLAPPAVEGRPKQAPRPSAPKQPDAEVYDLELDGSDEPGHLPVTALPPPPPIARHDAAEADGLFRDALTAFREGRTADASTLFARFVERYPDHAHADKALYWMGESRLEAGAWAEAVGDFRKLLLRYPRSRKVPDALFKMGLAYERLGGTAEARQAFSDLVTNYPATALADLARARLGGETGGTR